MYFKKLLGFYEIHRATKLTNFNQQRQSLSFQLGIKDINFLSKMRIEKIKKWFKIHLVGYHF